MEYKDSGVDRTAAYDFVDDLETKVRETYRPEVLSGLGGYGGFFQAPSRIKEPVFVATTDGVGTKLLYAEMMGKTGHRAVGQDAVAMCVNDLLACGAEPLIFLDYLATGKLDRKAIDPLLEGIIKACKETGCALIGGETAQMPGFYENSRYDVAGFSVGVLENSKRFVPSSIVEGDRLVGFPSSGFHSNGFSLIRRVVTDEKWTLDTILEGKALGDGLIEPTRLYVKTLLSVFKKFSVKGAAHITGGGLCENLPRMLPADTKLSFILDRNKIQTPPLMRRFVEAAKLSEREAYSTWNMGIGFCIVCTEAEAEKVLQFVPEARVCGALGAGDYPVTLS